MWSSRRAIARSCRNRFRPSRRFVWKASSRPLLSQADQALGRLDGSIQTLPDPDLFVFMYVRKEAVLSSQIEGTQSSLQDVLAAEARLRTPDRARDTDEVINYVTAMNYGLERLADVADFQPPDPGNPRTTAARCPRFRDPAG